MKLDQEAIEAFQIPDTYVPENIRGGIERYIECGITGGNFLEAVLCNDLKGACFSADPVTVNFLPSIVRWLWNYAPHQCHGSENHVRGWVDARQHDMAQEVNHNDGPRQIRGKQPSRTHEQKESAQDKFV